MTASYEGHGRLVLCAAYRAGLYGAKVVWIFPGWYNPNWWRLGLENVPCTLEEMDKAAEGHLLVAIYYITIQEQRSFSGLTASEFTAQRLKEPTYAPDAETYGFLAPSTYDSVWGSALALHCSITEMQNRDLKKVMVGGYVLEEEEQYIQWFNGGIRWPGGVVPRDSTQVTMVHLSLPLMLYVPMSFGASLGIILAISLLIFNIIYRKHTYVNLSSPNINNVLVCGCILTHSSVYMYSNDKVSVLFCKLRHFTFTTDFTMAFGAMFSKTWRVYKIFCNKKLLRVKINDFQLIAIVIVMVVIMLLILVIWEAVDSLTMQTVHLEQQSYKTGTDAIAIPVVVTCTSVYYYYFLLTICIMEGAMLAFGAFLSFETRKIRIAALNDSHQIGMCLYNVIVLSLLVIVLSVALDNQIALVYGIVSGIVILGTTTTLLIIFVPKIQGVFYPHLVATVENTQSTVGMASRFNRSMDAKTTTTQEQESSAD